ncbi:MAG: nucleoside deaminase [Deltaproteobacteria bacterium]|nr:nucleoside deaminase [Deltaproteobacteria bacterium]
MRVEGLATFFAEAVKLAEKAYNSGEIPVGAVIVKDGVIIGRGYNRVENRQCQLWHAEVIAVKEATKKLGNWRLNDCEAFVTLEPCIQCAGLFELSRIKKVYYLLPEPRFGFVSRKRNIATSLICSEFQDSFGYKNMLQQFFKEIRTKKTSSNPDYHC